MPTTDAQDWVFDDLFSGYFKVQIVPLANGGKPEGPHRAHCYHESGQIIRMVTVTADGKVTEDKALELKTYDPRWDVILVAAHEEDSWTFVPPPRSSMLPVGEMTRDDALCMAEGMCAWKYQLTGCGDMVVWELHADSLVLKGPFRREPDGWTQ